MEEPVVAFPAAFVGSELLAGDVEVVSEVTVGDRLRQRRGRERMGGHLGEAPVAAPVVAVAVRVDDEDGLVSQRAGRRRDVREAKARVDEHGTFRALDEEAVDVARLGDQPCPRLDFLDREPRGPVASARRAGPNVDHA